MLMIGITLARQLLSLHAQARTSWAVRPDMYDSKNVLAPPQVALANMPCLLHAPISAKAILSVKEGTDNAIVS